MNTRNDASGLHDQDNINIENDIHGHYTLLDEHLPLQDGDVLLWHDMLNIAKVTRLGSHININILVDNPVNIFISIQCENLSIRSVSDICVDSPMQVNQLTLQAGNIVLYGNIVCDKIVCLAQDSLTFQEGSIQAIQLLSVKSQSVVQHAEVISTTQTICETREFYTALGSKTSFNFKNASFTNDSLGVVVISEGSECTFTNGYLTYDSFLNNGHLTLNAMKTRFAKDLSTIKFTMIGDQSALNMMNSCLKQSVFSVKNGIITGSSSQVEAEIITFFPTSANLVEQQLKSHQMHLAGNCQFHAKSSLDFEAELTISGHVALNDSRIKSHNLIGSDLLLVTGQLELISSIVAVESVLIKETGKMSVMLNDSSITTNFLRLIDQGQLAVDSARVTTNNIMHSGAIIALSHKAELYVKNDFYCLSPDSSVNVDDRETNDAVVIERDNIYSSINNKITIIDATVEVGHHFEVNDLFAQQAIVTVSNSLMVTKGKGMYVDISVLTVNAAVNFYGAVNIKASHLDFKHDVVIGDTFNAVDTSSTITIGNDLIIRKSANVLLGSSLSILNKAKLQGHLTLASHSLLQVRSELTTSATSTLLLEGGHIQAHVIRHHGCAIVKPTPFMFSPASPKIKRSKITALLSFTAERGSHIKGSHTAQNLLSQLAITAPSIQTLGAIEMPYMKCEGDCYVNDARLTIAHYILKMNYSGVSCEHIEAGRMELCMPIWENKATVNVTQQLLSRTLFEEPGLLAVANRDSKTLLTIGLDTSVFVPPALSDLLDPAALGRYLLHLVTPSVIMSSYQTMNQLYSLSTLLIDGGSKIQKKLNKRYLKYYKSDLSIFENVLSFSSEIQYHEMLNVFWNGQSAISQTNTLIQQVHSTKKQLSMSSAKIKDTVADIDQHYQVIQGDTPSDKPVTAAERITPAYLSAAWTYILPQAKSLLSNMQLKDVSNCVAPYLDFVLPAQMVTSLTALNLFNVSLNHRSWNLLRINAGIDLSLLRTLNSSVIADCGFVGAWQSSLTSTCFVAEGLIASYKLYLEGGTLSQSGTLCSATEMVVLFTHWNHEPGSQLITPSKIITQGKTFTADGLIIKAGDLHLQHSEPSQIINSTLNVETLQLDGDKYKLTNVTGEVKYQVVGTVASLDIHDSKISYGTMSIAGDFSRTGDTVLTATGEKAELPSAETVTGVKAATAAQSAETSANTEMPKTEFAPSTQILGHHIHLGQGTSGDTKDTYYKATHFTDHSQTTFKDATQYVDAEHVIHTGRAAGKNYVVRSSNIPALTGECHAEHLQVESSKLTADEAAKLIIGKDVYAPYEASQSLTVVSEAAINITQAMLVRNVALTLIGSCVKPQEKIVYANALIMHSLNDCTSNYPVSASVASFTSDKSLTVATGANIIGEQVVVGSGEGNLELNAECVGTDSTQYVMKNTQDYQFIVRKQVQFQAHWKHHAPKDKNVLANHVYYFRHHNQLQYKVRDSEGELHSGYINDLNLATNVRTLINDVGSKLASLDVMSQQYLLEEVASSIVVRHDLGQGKLSAGAGIKQNGFGMYLKVGKTELYGPVHFDSIGHVVGEVESLKARPSVTTIIKETEKPPKAIQQKAFGMKRRKKIITEQVAQPRIKSEQGYVALDIKGEISAPASLFHGKQGVFLKFGGEVHGLALVTKNKTEKRTTYAWGGAWKEEYNSEQQAYLSEFKTDGKFFCESEGNQYWTGARIESHGGELVTKNKIFLSAPILEMKSLRIDHEIKVYINGTELSRLFETMTTSAVALFTNKKVPKDKWQALFNELCAREPMLGVLKESLGSNSIYDKVIRGWNTGLTGAELINQLAQAINKDNLTHAIATRYNVAEADVRVVFNHARHTSKFYIVDGRAGIHSSEAFKFDAQKLGISNGFIVQSEGIIIKVPEIIAHAAELPHYECVSKLGFHLGYNGGVHGGVSAERHISKGKRYQAPLLISPWIHFDHVETLTGTLDLQCAKLSGSIQNMNLVSVPDTYYQEDARFNVSTTGAVGAYYCKGSSKRKGAGFVTWKAVDASEFSCGKLHNEGAVVSLPGATFGEVTGEKIKLYNRYAGLGLSGNVNDSSSDAIYAPIDIEMNFANDFGAQQAVVNGAADIGIVCGKLCTDGSDGYQYHQGLNLHSTLIVPLTNASRLENFSENVRAASLKIAQSIGSSASAVNETSITEQSSEIYESEAETLPCSDVEISKEVEGLIETEAVEEIATAPTNEPEVWNSKFRIFSASDEDLDDDIEQEELFGTNAALSSQLISDPSDAMPLVSNETPLALTSLELLVLGAKNGSSGLILVSEPERNLNIDDLDVWDRFCLGVGNLASDMPVIIATSKAMLRLLQVCKVSPLGMAASAAVGAAAFSIPTFIREARESYYHYQLSNPDAEFSLTEFVETYGMDIMKETGSSALSGALIGIVGVKVRSGLCKTKLATRRVVDHFVTTELTATGEILNHAGNAVALSVVPPLIHFNLPTFQSFTDNFLLVGFATGAGLGSKVILSRSLFQLNQQRHSSSSNGATLPRRLNKSGGFFETKFSGPTPYYVESPPPIEPPNLPDPRFYGAAELVSKHCFFKPGEISPRYRDTFVGLCYDTYRLTEDFIFYRAGSKDVGLGQFLSFDKPMSEVQARIDSAICPVWPDGGSSVVEAGYAVKVPKGTIVHVGDIAATEGTMFLGGTKQIFVEKAWAIQGVEILEKYDLPEEIFWNDRARYK